MLLNLLKIENFINEIFHRILQIIFFIQFIILIIIILKKLFYLKQIH